MTFARRRYRPTTHFSERISVVKRRISVYDVYIHHKTSWYTSHLQNTNETHCAHPNSHAATVSFTPRRTMCLTILASYIKKNNRVINPLSPELNPICYLLALLGAHYFLFVSRIRVKLLTFRLLMSYIYGAPILDVSRSHTMTQHSR